MYMHLCEYVIQRYVVHTYTQTALVGSEYLAKCILSLDCNASVLLTNNHIPGDLHGVQCTASHLTRARVAQTPELLIDAKDLL